MQRDCYLQCDCHSREGGNLSKNGKSMQSKKNKFRVCIFLLSCFLSLGWIPACAGMTRNDAGMTSSQQALIVDTDADIDDQIALIYLLQNKQVTIKAITIEAESVTQCETAENHLMPVMQLPHRKFIPVACEEASKLLAATLKQAKKPLDILAIGPLTNLATVIKQHPHLKHNIHRIYLMGGAIHVLGNLEDVNPAIKNKLAEWNIYVDPPAAESVFKSKIPIYLIPLDVTNQVPLDLKFYNAVKKNQSRPAMKLLYQLLNQNKAHLLSRTWFFWDPLAAVIATHPHLATFKIEKLSVLQFPQEKYGATVVDNDAGSPIFVAQSVNSAQFKKILLGE